MASIVQIGAPAAIFERPATLAVAGFIGTPPMNLVRAHADGAAVRVGDTVTPWHGRIPGPPRDIMLGVRPGDIAADGQGLLAEVYVSELLGETTIVNLKIGAELVKMRVNGGSPFRDGEQIRVRLDPNRLHLFERDTGKRIEVKRIQNDKEHAMNNDSKRVGVIGLGAMGAPMADQNSAQARPGERF